MGDRRRCPLLVPVPRLAARAGSGRGTAATDCADMETGGTALAQQAAAFLEGLMAPLDKDEGAEGDAGGKAAGGRGRAGHAADSSERGAPAMRGGSDSSDDEPTGQQATAPRDGPQTTSTGAAAEVVRRKAEERKARQVRTDSKVDGNGQGAPARGNENGNDGKAKAKGRRTATRGRVYKIGSLDSSGEGGATTEGAPGGGASAIGRSSGWGRARQNA